MLRLMLSLARHLRPCARHEVAAVEAGNPVVGSSTSADNEVEFPVLREDASAVNKVQKLFSLKLYLLLLKDGGPHDVYLVLVLCCGVNVVATALIAGHALDHFILGHHHAALKAGG